MESSEKIKAFWPTRTFYTTRLQKFCKERRPEFFQRSNIHGLYRCWRQDQKCRPKQRKIVRRMDCNFETGEKRKANFACFWRWSRHCVEIHYNSDTDFIHVVDDEYDVKCFRNVLWLCAVIENAAIRLYGRELTDGDGHRGSKKDKICYCWDWTIVRTTLSNS